MLRFYFVAWCFCGFTVGYRLNVPRVLLPYHPSTQVKYDLIVSDPEHGCFTWRSTRPDIVSVRAMNPRGASGCSAEAQIAATSKHAEEQTAVVFAEDKDAGIILSCGVTVDVIRKIGISTTTKVLFLDASPAKIAIQAFNAEGDMFTNLGDIPFEWHFEPSSALERPLRIVPFWQSKYEAPDGVRLLEENKKRGFVILVEGVSTGAAVLSAKLTEPHFKNVESRKIELVVVANLLLVPSQDIYLPLGSIVLYSAEIVKQGATEPIRLPSKQYHLAIKDLNICSLDTSSSEVTAINFGTTEISLTDENVKSLSILKPPSAHIYVVEPSSLRIKISGDSWYLERNRDYYISLVLTDTDDNVMYIPENAKFMTKLSADYFRVINRSLNGSYFHVKAVKSGTAKLQAAFISVVDMKGNERRMPLSVRDEVTATISEPVEIVPSFVAFPYIDAKTVHSRKLLARGGTGTFTWSSSDPHIASVDPSGILLSGELGETEIIARDAQNNAHSGKAFVHVVQPDRVEFGKSRLEAEVGSDLVLYVTLRARAKNGEAAISDCRRVEFSVIIKDNSIFRMASDSRREVSPYGDGCSSFVLTAVAPGDTTVTVHFGSMSASLQISAFLPLKLETPSEVLVLLGSEFSVRTSGGPRPWILDSSKYFSKLEYGYASNLISDTVRDTHIITCKNTKGDVSVLAIVGNEPTSTNPLPAKSEIKMRVCCGVPDRLSLFLLRSYQSSCPANSAISFSEPSKLLLSAFGRCESGPTLGVEKQFDSLTSLHVKWSANESNLVQVAKDASRLESHNLRSILKPQKLTGVVEIVATADKYTDGRRERSLSQKLQGAIKLLLVEHARAAPSSIVLLNEKMTSKTIRLKHGSGHFALMAYDGTVVDANLDNSIAKIRPLVVGKTELEFTDLCIGNNFTATVSVTDVDEITIEAPEFIALNSEQKVQLIVRDVEGSFFVTDDANIMNAQLNASSDAVTIARINALNYVLRGNAVGVVTLRASARRANGRVLQSQPHSIQVFAQLQLQPKTVTLIPDSVFQLEVSGGPQPLPPVRYRLNDTSVATVAQNGLITSKKVGYAKVVGSVGLDQDAFIEDYVVVKTVSLAGIRIRISTTRIEIGENAWARVDGLADDETPFSFGGALHPLKISWSTTTPGIVEIASPLEALVAESVENQFQIELKSLRVGQTMLRVSVTVPADSKAFTKVNKHYEDQLTVIAVEPLKLVSPSRHLSVLRLSPDAELDLRSNREDSSVQFVVPAFLSRYVAVVGETSSILRARAVGDAAVVLKQTKDPYKELTYFPVSVMPVASLHFDVKFSKLPEKSLAVLPLGYHLRIDIISRDHLGRLFDAAKHSMNFRPHRFDLTEIFPTNDNHSFDIQLKEVGETVFKVWDKNNPELNAFLRLPVDSVILPHLDSVIVSEITCFKSPLPTVGWKELDAKRRFQFIDEKNGIAVARSPGNAVVASFDLENQTIFTKVKIVPAASLYFSSVPSFISNIKGHRYALPVIVSSGEHGLSNVHGCSSSVLETIRFDVPFDCIVSFVGEVNVMASSLLTAQSAFLPDLGKYGCLLEEQTFDGSSSLMEYHNLALHISAIWNHVVKVKEASATVNFYPRFEIMQREIRLNNVNTLEAELVINSPVSTSSKISLETGTGNVLLIEGMKSTSPAVLRYQIRLNVHSALLWQELLDKCNITVKNTLTGQVEVVPVIVVLHGDASKAVLRASDSFFGILGSFLESTAVQVCASLLTAAFIAVLIAHCKGYSFWSYLFGSVYNADPNSSYGTIFAREHPQYRSQFFSPGSRSMFSPDLSALSSSNRSAGSPGEPILWSVPDDSFSSSDLRRRLQISYGEPATDDRVQGTPGVMRTLARTSPTSSITPPKIRKDGDDLPFLLPKLGSSPINFRRSGL